MNKRITSLLLCFVMIIAMMATAVPALAVSSYPDVTVSIVTDKTTAKPGDIIDYSVVMGAVQHFQGIQFLLSIPDGLEYVANSATVPDGLNEKLGSDEAIWTEHTMVYFIYGEGSYTSTQPTTIFAFKCKVKDDASGEQVVDFDTSDPGSNLTVADDEYEEITAIPITTTVTVIQPHTHNMTPVTARPATCTAEGSTAYYICNICNNWYQDEAGNNEITDHNSVVLTALGHDYTERIENAAHKKDTAADCRSKDTYWYDCSRCDKNAKDDPAASNKWFTSNNAGPHSYDESDWGYKGDDGHAHKCRYDNTHDTPVAHTPGAAATETTPQTCTECGFIIAEALGHTHNMTPVTARPATCTAEGNTAYYKCEGCGKWFEDLTGNIEITDHNSVVLTALGHDYTERIEDAAHKKDTATDCRSKDTYWYDCSRCDKNAKDDPAASNKWFTSNNAGHHVYDSMHWTDYNDEGHARKCLYCDAHAELVNHRPGTAATETTPQTCVDCGHIITPATGHIHNMTPVAARAATCTAEGNTAYYKCEGCGKWFEDSTGNIEITDHNRVTVAALDHDWEPASCTEPKTCKREGCGATEGDPLGHTPDRAAATINDPVKCTTCEIILEPKLESATVEIPFTLTVKQGGNTAPGEQTFELEIFDIGNSNEESYADVTYTATVKTNGKGDYTAKVTVIGPREQVENFCSEGFFIREKNTNAANWTYSDAVWFVIPSYIDDVLVCTVYPTKFEISDNGEQYVFDRENPAEQMTFENTYTENKTVEAEKPNDSEKPTESVKQNDTQKSPKTGNRSNMILLFALLFVSGTAVTTTAVYSRKRKTVK